MSTEADDWPEGDPRSDYMPVLERIEDVVATIRIYTMIGLIVLIFFVVAVVLLIWVLISRIGS